MLQISKPTYNYLQSNFVAALNKVKMIEMNLTHNMNVSV